MIKSKIIGKLHDFRGIEVPEERAIIKIDKSVIDKEIDIMLSEKNGIHSVEDEVQNKDIVTINAIGGVDRFNKENIKIAVGVGLYDKAVEAQLLGMKKGESKTIEIGTSKVTVEVLDVQRRTIVTLTDEFVVGLNIEGVNTIEEYKNYKLEKLKEEKVVEVGKYLAVEMKQEVVENTEFEIDEDEVKDSLDGLLTQLKANAPRFGKTYEEIIRMFAFMGQKENPDATIEECKELLVKKIRETIKSTLVAVEIVKEDNMIFNEDMYEEEMAKISSEKNIPVEDVKKQMRYISYLDSKVGIPSLRKIIQYLKENELKFEIQ